MIDLCTSATLRLEKQKKRKISQKIMAMIHQEHSFFIFLLIFLIFLPEFIIFAPKLGSLTINCCSYLTINLYLCTNYVVY